MLFILLCLTKQLRLFPFKKDIQMKQKIMKISVRWNVWHTLFGGTAHPGAIIGRANSEWHSELCCLPSDTAEMHLRHTEVFPRGYSLGLPIIICLFFNFLSPWSKIFIIYSSDTREEKNVLMGRQNHIKPIFLQALP